MNEIIMDEKFKTIEKLYDKLTKVHNAEYDVMKKELLSGVDAESATALESVLEYIENER